MSFLLAPGSNSMLPKQIPPKMIGKKTVLKLNANNGGHLFVAQGLQLWSDTTPPSRRSDLGISLSALEKWESGWTVGPWKPGRKVRLWSFVEIVKLWDLCLQILGVWVVESSTHLTTCSFRCSTTWATRCQPVLHVCVFCVSPSSLAFWIFAWSGRTKIIMFHCYICIGAKWYRAHGSYSLLTKLCLSTCTGVPFFLQHWGEFISPTTKAGFFIGCVVNPDGRSISFNITRNIKATIRIRRAVFEKSHWELVVLALSKVRWLNLPFFSQGIIFFFCFKPPSSATKLSYTKTPSHGHTKPKPSNLRCFLSACHPNDGRPSLLGLSSPSMLCILTLQQKCLQNIEDDNWLPGKNWSNVYFGGWNEWWGSLPKSYEDFWWRWITGDGMGPIILRF